MPQDHVFFRIIMLTNFLDEVQQLKQKLRDELINNGSDPVIRMRRFRMLSQLSLYESQTINKIYELETDNELDFLSYDRYVAEARTVINRNG